MSGTGATIGYLLVAEPRDAVFVGGLLVTTHHGRPLEFRCTAPVTPNATQRMLYGATLRPHVCGDVIGAALLKKAATAPSLILTATADALDVREHAKCPVAVLVDDGRDPHAERPAMASEATFDLGPLRLSVHDGYLEDIGQIRALDLDTDADLSEPLERVREALGQTLRAEAA